MKPCIVKNIVLLMAWLLLADMAYSQEVGRNYVMQRRMLEADGSRYLDVVTYVDGLGRELETVHKALTPLGKTMVSMSEYDAVGRLCRQWLPVVCGNGEYVSLSDVREASAAQYGDECAYTEIVYEHSPFSRVSRVTGPGAAWHEGGYAVETEYGLNTSEGRLRCMAYAVDDDGMLECSGVCEAGSLVVKQVVDEDGRVSLMFADAQGRVVLERREVLSGQYADTYYVYDGYGNLRYVLPPELSKRLSGIGEWDTNDDAVWDFAYTYRYNGRGQVIWRKLPGCEPVVIGYDAGGYPVLEQDGVQRERGEWTLHVPDRYGREVFTAIILGIAGSDVFADVYVTAAYDGETVQTGGYAVSIPLPDQLSMLTVSYYDDYDFVDLEESGMRAALAYKEMQGYGEVWNNVAGMLTGCRVYEGMGGGTYTVEAIYYDSYGRIVESHASNRVGGMDDWFWAYTFTGNPERSFHQHSGHGSRIEEAFRFEYDHAGRLSRTWYSLGDEEELLLEEVAYDELCRVSGKTLNGRRIATAYEYNIRGWQTLQQSPNFREQVDYESHPDGNPSMSGKVNVIHTAVGNMAAQMTNIFSTSYRYDGIGRLSGSECVMDKEDYATSYSYDLNGNMTAFERNGRLQPGLTSSNPGQWKYGTIDDVELEYDGNHLLRATDNVPGLSYGNASDFDDGGNEDVEYVYDAVGRLACDANRGITRIMYDAAGCPSNVMFADGSVTAYGYDATGTKYRAQYMSPPETAVTPGGGLSGDVELKPFPGGGGTPSLRLDLTREYCGNVIYKDGTLERILTPSGYAVPDGAGGYALYWYIRDRQGSVRAVLDSLGLPVEQNRYYPYGLPIEVGETQPYKYGGKEYDRMNGLDAYDFSARWYDPSLCRFMSMDPQCERYYSLSPYAYCGGDPVNFIDPTGEDAMVVVTDSTITIHANIILEGEKATEDLAKIYYDGIMITWGIFTWYDYKIWDYKYKTYQLIWDVDVRVMADGEKRDFNGINNYFTVVPAFDKDGREILSRVLNTHEGRVRYEGWRYPLISENPMPHEFGHVLGLRDRYKVTATSNPDSWRGNIMAEPSGFGSVETRNIDAVVRKAVYYHELYSGSLREMRESMKKNMFNNFPLMNLFSTTYYMINQWQREPPIE